MSSILEDRYLDDGQTPNFIVVNYVGDIETAAGAAIVADLPITKLSTGRFRVTNPGTETGHVVLRFREVATGSILKVPTDYVLRNDGTAHYPTDAKMLVDIAAVKTDTAEIGADGAGLSAIPNMATATNQAAIAGYIDTEVSSILSSVNALPTLAQILAGGDVDGFTLEETLKLCLAALAGILSGAGGTTITIRSADDSADRIIALVDAQGNRISLTLNAAG